MKKRSQRDQVCKATMLRLLATIEEQMWAQSGGDDAMRHFRNATLSNVAAARQAIEEGDIGRAAWSCLYLGQMSTWGHLWKHVLPHIRSSAGARRPRGPQPESLRSRIKKVKGWRKMSYNEVCRLFPKENPGTVTRTLRELKKTDARA